jgi:hypothetical protein
MYLVGQGHEHTGPGTSLSQRINWTRAQELQDNRGMGCASCAGLAGCRCGLGDLFASGFDWTGWGWPEWVSLGLGAFVLYSVFSTGQRGVRSGRRRVSRALQGRARRAAAGEAI